MRGEEIPRAPIPIVPISFPTKKKPKKKFRMKKLYGGWL